jgi:hypothetical protein
MSYGFIADDAWFHAQTADKGLPVESDYYTALKNAVDAVAIEHRAFPTVVKVKGHSYWCITYTTTTPKWPRRETIDPERYEKLQKALGLGVDVSPRWYVRLSQDCE